jgi:hypothetical protein
MAMAATNEKAPPEVRDFLKKHGAEADFQSVVELAEACFPESRAMKVELHEDPEEEDRERVVVWVILPESYPDDLLQEQVRSYHERLVTTIPLSRCPFFVLLNDFVRE